MRKLLFFALALWLFGAFLLRAKATDPSVRARVALALASVPMAPTDPFSPNNGPKVACNCTGPQDCICSPGTCTCSACTAVPPLTYRQGWKEAMQTGKPLAVFVNTSVIPLEGFITCATDNLPDHPEPGVVLGCRAEGVEGLEQIASFYGPITESRALAAVKEWRSRKIKTTPFASIPQPLTFRPAFAPAPVFSGGMRRGGGGC